MMKLDAIRFGLASAYAVSIFWIVTKLLVGEVAIKNQKSLFFPKTLCLSHRGSVLFKIPENR